MRRETRDALILLPGNTEPLSHFEPISLAQMEDVALLNRTDTKYLFRTCQLRPVLAAIRDHYQILDMAGVREHHYQTLYFDTPGFALYLRHHNGARDRYKVRCRRYVDSDRAFLEVKFKAKRGRTVKKRLKTRGLVTHFSPETRAFMEAHFPLNRRCLQPTLWNDFCRMTLVGKHRQERVTIDVDLKLWSGRRAVALPGVVVAEVKQDGVDRHSPFVRQMRAIHSRPTGFSKYCVGISLLYPEQKRNRFKSPLRLLMKVMEGKNHVPRTH